MKRWGWYWLNGCWAIVNLCLYATGHHLYSLATAAFGAMVAIALIPNHNAELREQLARLDGMIEVTRELRRELEKEPTQ